MGRAISLESDAPASPPDEPDVFADTVGIFVWAVDGGLWNSDAEIDGERDVGGADDRVVGEGMVGGGGVDGGGVGAETAPEIVSDAIGNPSELHESSYSV